MGDKGELLVDRLVRHWRPVVFLFWIAASIWFVVERWAAIKGFSLGDTDDNMRMMQVRALMSGQDWYDLRQYRLNPPFGADIHWSRLVDLPIAALKYVFTPLFGGRQAETIAVTVAPLLPMLVAMLSLATVVRRLVDPRAFWIAITVIVCAGSTRGMWYPLRIDHHGWQLAMLSMVLVGLTDPRRARGGIVLGLATAASLAIGLEMLLYLGLGGGIAVLRWIWDREEAKRLLSYGLSLGGGSAFAFLLFASEANRQPVCDALSPVWLSVMAMASAIAVLLSFSRVEGRGLRLGIALAGGAAIAAFYLLAWPDCVGRLERTSPELERLWLTKVREALPVWRHGAQTAALIVALPIIGLIGYATMLWVHRRDPPRAIVWAGVALPALLAACLLLWQTRAGPAAQLLAVPGASALGWHLMIWLRSSRMMIVRVVGVAAVFMLVSGLAAGYLAALFPTNPSDFRKSVNRANNRCPTLAALRPIARQPAGTVLTFVDLGPRLIAVTPHSALAGPYHRNGAQILDVMKTWRGDAANARSTVERYRVDYVLICPNLSESTIYRAEAPQGFYAQLMRGRVPEWMEPVALPPGSPYRMWRVVN